VSLAGPSLFARRPQREALGTRGEGDACASALPH